MLRRERIADVEAGRLEAVVIGTSAGGVDALGVILPALPAETPFPVVVVVHMPPRETSLIVNVFRSRCAIAVSEPRDKEDVTGGVAWFAPPNYHLLVECDRTFALSIEAPVHHCRPSIDALFESAADAYGRHLVAIVLTGANEDGADGAAAVHDAGGIVIVQDPATAEMPFMPRAASARAHPDAVGTLQEIAAVLRAAAIARHR
jgi:two-component system, chemotaxis family, protein-glutamate methylesterase/glutaminase